MCGIAGVVDGASSIDGLPRVLGDFRRALAHRGPDDEGQWMAADARAGFAHTRLSIIDLSPAGHQPMSTPDGRLTIVFNGEIYNYRELRAELERDGAAFRGHADTEVILRGHERHGLSWAERLRGMFAYAIWDASLRTLSLVRDPFGIKPLYYAQRGSRLAFASEVRALVGGGFAGRGLDPEGLYGYFRQGTVPEPRTLLADVRCLPAGHHAVWKDGRLEAPRAYWRLMFAPSTMPAGDAPARIRTALLDSVAHHFVSDVPVGVFLSGGIDSTAVLAAARAVGQTELHSFSIGFPGLPNDESAVARQTAARFGTTHHEWLLDASAGRELFAEYLVAMDQPTIDGLNTFAVSALARREGLKVVLSGVGGDEIFGGYPSFRAVPRLARAHAWARWSGFSLLGPVIERCARDPRTRRMGDLLTSPPGLGTAYTTYRGVFTRAEARRLCAAAGAPIDAAPEPAVAEADPDAGDTVSRLELTRYMRNQLLRDGDVMSMAHGLELRVPFVDRGLVAGAAGIPAGARLGPGKRLLVEAMPEIGDDIARAPKRGFAFPIQDWLDGSWQDLFAGVERSSPVALGSWYRKWVVFVLREWMSKTIGAESPSERGRA